MNTAYNQTRIATNQAPSNVKNIVRPYTAEEWKQIKGWKEDTGVVQSANLARFKNNAYSHGMWQYMRLRKGFHQVIFKDSLEPGRWGLELGSLEPVANGEAHKYKNPELWRLMEEKDTLFLGQVNRGDYVFFAQIPLPGGRVCMPAIRWTGGINKAKSLFIPVRQWIDYKENR